MNTLTTFLISNITALLFAMNLIIPIDNLFAERSDNDPPDAQGVVESSQKLLSLLHDVPLADIGSNTPGREESVAEVEENLSPILEKTTYDYSEDNETRMHILEAIIFQISLIQHTGADQIVFSEDHVRVDDDAGNVYSATLLPRVSAESTREQHWREYASKTDQSWDWHYVESEQQWILDIDSLSSVSDNAVSPVALHLMQEKNGIANI